MFRSIARFLLSLALCVSLSAPCFALDIPSGGSLTPEQGMALLEEQAGKLTILDVRTPGEFAAGHAPGALHIPVSELGARVAEVPAGPVLIVCRSGRRAQSAASILLRSGRPAEGLWYLSGYTDYSGGGVRFHN